MSGDYSRHRFDPHNNYAGVKMQQGRVQLDADWNEWAEVGDRRTRAETVDTFGVSLTPGITGVSVVSPQTPDAFLIDVSGGDVTIGLGRMYVDGLLAENFGAQNASRIFEQVLAELYGQNPVAWHQQPYHPVPGNLPGNGPHLAYLEVWQREVTHLQRPDLIEKAIGVDTTTRDQTVWQVRLLENIDDTISCTSPDADLGPAWANIIGPSAARLSSRAVGVPPDEDPCELPPSGGYRGLENQLYRIEIHDVDSGGAPTFKWSRDNGSVASGVVEVISGTELKLTNLGRDAVLRFNTGDWVEIIDDWRELSGVGGDPARRLGEMRRITVADASQTISFNPALPADLIPTGVGENTLAKRHLRVIRWDQKGEVRDENDNLIVDLGLPGSQGVIPVPAAGVWVHLEKGIQIQFSRDPSGGDFRCNDYWTVAARTADTSVEILTAAPPKGLHRHYARLARITFPDDEIDCRTHWPPGCGGGCCTVTVDPGDDIQAAIDSLPDDGGCVCLKTGVHEIRSPLEIHASHIKLHGCNPGVVIRAIGALPYLLEIGADALSVTDVEVISIRFEATEPTENAASLLYLNNCTQVRIALCEMELIENIYSSQIGIWMQDVRDVVVTDNHLRNLHNGIWVDNYHERLIIRNNVIEGITIEMAGGNFSFGWNGIQIDNEFVAPCQIEHNQIDHFWTAVWLRGGARYSLVAHNQIRRIGGESDQSMPASMNQLRLYLSECAYAIDIEAEFCRVERNYIGLPGAHFGGIRTMAEHTSITGNILRAASKDRPLMPLPPSIYCYNQAEEGSGADHSRVGNNKLTGPQTGIVISRIDDVTVEDNYIDGEGTGWFGVRVDDCNESRVCGNRIEEVFFATYHSAGEFNHVCDNHISHCGLGVSAMREDDFSAGHNTITDCLQTGIMAEVVSSATLIGNRISFCGHTGPTSMALGVFAEQITLETDSLIRIEGNDVLDTGINPQTGAGTNMAACGIGVMCPVCQISHNRTDYTSAVLDPMLEHRALLLVGPLALRYNMGHTTLELMFGSAGVTDNHFRGPGASFLVEFFRLRVNEVMDFRFEKVMFNNNICNHQNAEQREDAATIRLLGKHLIVMGNHVKADDHVNAMSLAHSDHIALMGNVTTGGYTQIGTVTPAPLTSYNVRT
jgi:nitrous oxidase accessory protein NosD